MVFLKKFKFVVFFIALMAMSFQINGQDPFQRYYSAMSSSVFNGGSTPASNGGFYTVNVVQDNTTQTVDRILVTAHNPKGNIDWNKVFEFENETIPSNIEVLDILNIDDQELIISIVPFDPSLQGLADQKYLIRINLSDQEVIWTGEVSDSTDAVHPFMFPTLVNDFNGNFTYFGTHADDTGFGIHRIQYGPDNEILDQSSYFPRVGGAIIDLAATVDARNAVDSTYMLTYIPDVNSASTALLKIDTEGELLSSTTYSVSPDSIQGAIIQTIAIATTPDTGTVMGGIILNPATNELLNHIVKVDSLGNVEWSNVIGGAQFGFIAQVSDVLSTPAGEIMAIGKYIDVNDFSQADFAIFFDEDGNVLRQLDYGSDESLFLLILPNGQALQFSNGEVEPTADGGMIYSTTGFDAVASTFAPIVMKMDEQGGALCNDTLDLQVVRPFDLVRDTLPMRMDTIAVTDTLVVPEDFFSDFDFPLLNLIDTVYCPQDPINQLIDAEVEGASSYEWSTGETTPTIRVFEEGEYSVTVTLEDRICYSLCDTANISQRDFPEAMINADFSLLCELDQITLRPTSTTDIISYEWSTGDQTSFLDVTGPGAYSVTITDSCMNTASADISFDDDDFVLGVTATTGPISSPFCQGGDSFVSLIADGEGSFAVESYEWSTGEMTQSIQVSEPGEYFVTVTNICGEQDVTSVSVSADNLDVSFTAFITQEPDGCNGIVLNTSPNGVTYEWSTGQTSDTIRVFEPGVYTVTATDVNCNEFSVAETTVEERPGGITFPNMFFPNGTIIENRTYGPYVECPELFTGQNYKLEIYNRFGNKVFEATNVSSRWNGTYNSDQAPRDVYMFQWSYEETDGTMQTGEGHVTLHR